MIVRVGGEAGFEFRQHRLRAAALDLELDGAARGGDLGRFLDLGGRAVEHGERLVFLAQREQGAGDAGERLGVLGFLLRQRAEQLEGRGMVAGGHRGLGLGHQIGPRHLAAGGLEQALDEALHLGFRQRALEQVEDLALPEGDHRGHRLQRQAHLGELADQLAVLVDVDLDQPDAAAGGLHHLLDRRGQLLAGAAPGGPEVDQHGHLAGRLDHVLHEGLLVAVLDDARVGGGRTLAGGVEQHFHGRHSSSPGA